MIKVLSTAVFAVFLLSEALAQNAEVTVRAFDGKTGKPLAHQRLLFFGGISEQKARVHQTTSEITTDDKGVAVLRVDLTKIKLFSTFADFMTMCNTQPNYRYSRVDTILTMGLAKPNECGSFAEKPRHGQLVIYARKPTLREKMAW